VLAHILTVKGDIGFTTRMRHVVVDWVASMRINLNSLRVEDFGGVHLPHSDEVTKT
jgi:hypothetical protein